MKELGFYLSHTRRLLFDVTKMPSHITPGVPFPQGMSALWTMPTSVSHCWWRPLVNVTPPCNSHQQNPHPMVVNVCEKLGYGRNQWDQCECAYTLFHFQLPRIQERAYLCKTLCLGTLIFQSPWEPGESHWKNTVKCAGALEPDGENL